MNTNTMELNLNEMELVNGGSIGDHVLGALVGVGTGFLPGCLAALPSPVRQAESPEWSAVL